MTINQDEWKEAYISGRKCGILLATALGIQASFLAGTVGFCWSASRSNNKLEHAADDAALVIYEPVTNGGAMQEFYHGRPTSGHRTEMYDTMDKIREAVMKER